MYEQAEAKTARALPTLTGLIERNRTIVVDAAQIAARLHRLADGLTGGVIDRKPQGEPRGSENLLLKLEDSQDQMVGTLERLHEGMLRIEEALGIYPTEGPEPESGLRLRPSAAVR